MLEARTNRADMDLATSDQFRAMMTLGLQTLSSSLRA
jgi:hypothetical protein